MIQEEPVGEGEKLEATNAENRQINDQPRQEQMVVPEQDDR